MKRPLPPCAEMSNRVRADRQRGRARQTRVQHLRTGHQGNISDPLGLEEQEMEKDGGKRKREGQSETSAEEDRDMEECSDSSKPESLLIRQVCSSSPSSQPQARGFLRLTGMWAESPRAAQERLAVVAP